MSTTVAYIAARGCLFLPPVEWSILESELSVEDREKYARTGYPVVTLENDETFKYLPLEFNGKKFKVVCASRPKK